MILYFNTIAIGFYVCSLTDSNTNSYFNTICRTPVHIAIRFYKSIILQTKQKTPICRNPISKISKQQQGYTWKTHLKTPQVNHLKQLITPNSNLHPYLFMIHHQIKKKKNCLQKQQDPSLTQSHSHCSCVLIFCFNENTSPRRPI